MINAVLHFLQSEQLVTLREQWEDCCSCMATNDRYTFHSNGRDFKIVSDKGIGTYDIECGDSEKVLLVVDVVLLQD